MWALLVTWHMDRLRFWDGCGGENSSYKICFPVYYKNYSPLTISAILGNQHKKNESQFHPQTEKTILEETAACVPHMQNGRGIQEKIGDAQAACYRILETKERSGIAWYLERQVGSKKLFSLQHMEMRSLVIKGLKNPLTCIAMSSKNQIGCMSGTYGTLTA